MTYREQIVGYLGRILKMENDMRDRYQAVSTRVNDAEIRNFLQTLRLEEESHARIVQGLIEVFSK